MRMRVSRTSSEKVLSLERRSVEIKSRCKISKGTWHQIKLQWSFCTPKFEGRSQEETWQGQVALLKEWKFNWIKKHGLLSNWSQGNGGAHFEITRGKRVRDWFQSFDAHAEQKGFELRRTGNSKEIQDLYRGGNGKWWSANKRGNKRVCSRSWPLRGCAITRWNARRLIACEALRRTRIFIWVGQRSATTVDQKGDFFCKTDNFVPPVVPEVSSSTGTCSSSTSSLQDLSFTSPETERSDEQAPGKWRPESQKQNKKKDDNRDAEECLRDLLQWLEEFTDNLETHKRLCVHTFLRTQIRNVLRKWQKDQGSTLFFHFPKDRNCEVCMRTKITRAPCRRRIGGAVLRAEKFGDLITADQKVLNEERESRNNHRYAIVVQDLAQSYPSKTKTSQDTEKSSKKFLEPSEKQKVIYTDNSLEFAKSCEDLSWNHRTSTPHRSQTNGIAERAVRRVKEGFFFCSSKDWMMVRFNGMRLLSAKCPRLLGGLENSLWMTLRRAIQRTGHSIWSSGRISSDFDKRSNENSSIRKDSFTWNVSWICVDRGGEFGKEIFWLLIWKNWKFFRDEPMRKKYWSHRREKNSFSHLQMVQQNCLEETTNSGNPLQGENILYGVKISVEDVKANRKSLDQQNEKMSLKPGVTFGQFKVTSFIVIILNLEFNSTCRKKKHSLFHCNKYTLT